MPELLEIFREKGREIFLRPGDHLFVQGESDRNVYLVRSGLLKAYYIRPDGREHIKSFLTDGSVIGSVVALMDGGFSTFSLMAVEASAVIAVPYKALAEVARRDVDFANALIVLLLAYGKRKERREYELLSLSSEDRYAILLETMPAIASRISQADMAAYIGVTPQALSRIKRRLKGAVPS